MWVWFVPGAWEIAEVDLDNLVLGMEFALNGGEGTEEEIGGVGHDGGAAGLDLVPGLITTAERNSSVPPMKK
jgi:hypothetical protein